MNGLRMLGLLSAVAALIAVIHGWSALSLWLQDKEAQALTGWIQALGSIAAIAATGWAVQRAHALQEQQRDEIERLDHTRLLEVVYQLVRGTAHTAKKIVEKTGDGKWEGGTRVPRGTLEGLYAEISAIGPVLNGIDVIRLNQIEFVRAALAAKTMAARLSLEFETALRGAQGEEHVAGGLILRAADTTMELLAVHCRQMALIILGRGGKPRDDSYLFY